MDVVDSRDPEAFRTFYRAHYRTVCRYLSVRADRDVVEDVAAETFLVAWRRQADLPDHAVPWLLNTACKCLANQRREPVTGMRVTRGESTTGYVKVGDSSEAMRRESSS